MTAKINPQLEAIIVAFGRQSGVTEEHVANLRKVLLQTPLLLERFNDAARSGVLDHIEPLTGSTAGGEYHADSDTIRIPVAILGNRGAARFDPTEAVCTLGHELQHAYNEGASEKARDQFLARVAVVAESPAVPRDYTRLVADYLGSCRRDEATSTLAGYNALVSHVKANAKGPVNLEAIYNADPGRAGVFIQPDFSKTPPSFALRPGLTANADLSITANAKNIDAVGRYYFDESAPVLGRSGALDYRNYYGVWAVNAIVDIEMAWFRATARQPAVALDMAGLGLKETSLEGEGIVIDGGSNFPYIDTSNGASTRRRFDERPMPTPAPATRGGEHSGFDAPLAAQAGRGPALEDGRGAHEWRDHLTADRALELAAARSNAREPASLHDVHSRDNGAVREPTAAPDSGRRDLMAQAHAAIARLDAGLGRERDHWSDQLASVSALLAARHGMGRIDHVLLSNATPTQKAGERVFVVEGAPDSVHRQMLSFATRDAFGPGVTPEAAAAQVAVDTEGLRLPAPAVDTQARERTTAVSF